MAEETGNPAVAEISVVMSVFNGMPLLAEAVDSILTQTFGNFEFIVINDGSTDGSLAYLQKKAAEDDRIRIIDQENTGLTRALIRGVAEARAPLIARMDADDISMPGRFAAQVAALQENPGWCAVSCGMEYIDEQGSVLGAYNRSGDVGVTALMMAFFNYISGHGQLMFRRDAYDTAAGYDPAFRFAQDYDLWTRMLRFGEIGYAQGAHYRFRLGEHRVSIRNSEEQRALAIRVAVREQQRLAGSLASEATTELLYELWASRNAVRVSSRRMLRADAVMRAVVKRSFKERPPQQSTQKAIEKLIAEFWVEVARRSPVGKTALALATRWNWRTAGPVIGAKLKARLPGFARYARQSA